MEIDHNDQVPLAQPAIEKVYRGSIPATPPVSDCIAMAATSYAYSIRQMMGEKAPSKEDLYQQGLEQIARMQPRDAVEEMLMSQMLMTHARILYTSRCANAQKNAMWSRHLHNAADRATNIYRQQMESLARYRRPRKGRRTNFTTIRTAHINAKQILTQTQPPAVSPVRNRTQEIAQSNHPPQAENETTDQTP